MVTLFRFLFECRSCWSLWVLPVLCIGMAVPLVIALPLVEKELIDGVMLAGRLDRLAFTAGLYALVWLVVTVTQIIGTVLRTRLDQRLTILLYRRLYDHYAAL